MNHDFEKFALDDTITLHGLWTSKKSLALPRIYEAIIPPAERTVPLLKPCKYNVLYIIRNHIHLDLKLEYVMEEETSTLWTALQTHYEQ
jgi:hypothetical protein